MQATVIEHLNIERLGVLFYAAMLGGVGVSAISGALAAGRKNLDPIGVLVMALVTGTGGGTIRDLLLSRRVFWIADTDYLLVCLVAAVLTWFWVKFYHPPNRVLIYADAVGLALFGVAGAQVAEQLGEPGIVMVVMGCLTGTAGGLLRDVLCAEIPLIFRKSELYVTACIAGLLVYVGLRRVGVDLSTAGAVTAVVILAARLASIKWRITLPLLRLKTDDP